LITHHGWNSYPPLSFLHYINFKTICKRIWATARQFLTSQEKHMVSKNFVEKS